MTLITEPFKSVEVVHSAIKSPTSLAGSNFLVIWLCLFSATPTQSLGKLYVPFYHFSQHYLTPLLAMMVAVGRTWGCVSRA